MTDLGTQRNDRSEAFGINDRGEIVGRWAYKNRTAGQAVLWSGRGVGAAPAARAPRLIRRHRGPGTPLRAVRDGVLATVTTLIDVDRQATVGLSVRDPRSGEQLTMQTGTRLGATTLTQPVTTMRTMVGSSRTLVLKALLPAEQLRQGDPYQLSLIATGAAGKRSTLRVRFLG